MKLLIDTNIYFDFYRSNNEGLKLLTELIEFDEYIILTDQIIQEFERNREKVIKTVQKSFEIESRLEKFSSSFLMEMDEFKQLLDIQNAYENKRSEIKILISQILKDPLKDKVATFFTELVNKCDKKGNIWYADKDIINDAHRRKLIGNPPTSDSISIGDEINWEIVIKNVKEDIVIVGRDLTYKDNLSFLRKDFHLKTGFFIFDLTDRITTALKMIGIQPSQELEAAENQMVESVGTAHYSEYWKRPSKDRERVSDVDKG